MTSASAKVSSHLAAGESPKGAQTVCWLLREQRTQLHTRLHSGICRFALAQTHTSGKLLQLVSPKLIRSHGGSGTRTMRQTSVLN